MHPDEVVRSFNPDTYIRHELDGTPIHGSDRLKYTSHKDVAGLNVGSKPLSKFKYIYELDSRPIYVIHNDPNYNLDPTTHSHELVGDPIDNKNLEGKLRYDVEVSKHLYDTVKHKLFVEAKSKQRSCGSELPVYHRKTLDLYSENKPSKHTAKAGLRFFKWIDNKPSDIFDLEAIEARAKHERWTYLYRQAKYKELIRQHNERMISYNIRFGKTK